jgi:hypothetical protein
VLILPKLTGKPEDDCRQTKIDNVGQKLLQISKHLLAEREHELLAASKGTQDIAALVERLKKSEGRVITPPPPSILPYWM